MRGGLIVAAITTQPAPLRGILAFEKLRAEFIAANEDLDETALLDACIKFAKMTGLTLRQQILEIRKHDQAKKITRNLQWWIWRNSICGAG